MKRNFGDVIKSFLSIVMLIIGILAFAVVIIILLYSKNDGFRNTIRQTVYKQGFSPNETSDHVNTEPVSIGNSNGNIKVELVLDPPTHTEQIYKISGYKMEYYILRETFDLGEATGVLSYEEALNNFFSAILVERNANSAERYIAKANESFLEAHENANVEYSNLQNTIKKTIEYLNAVSAESPIKNPTYFITKAAGMNIAGVDYEMVYVSYAYETEPEYVDTPCTIIMQKDKNGWKIVSAR